MAADTTETFDAHTVIFREDDPAEKIYIINSGAVQLTRRVFREEFTVETVGPGYVFGEVSLATGLRYTETATALEPCEVVVVESGKLPDLIKSGGDVALRLTQRLAQRLAFSHHRLSNFAMQTTLGRVMLQLRAEALRSGAVRNRAYADIPYDLPDVLSAEKGTVQECIQHLADSGLVDLDGGARFSIEDPSAFDRLLSYLELRDRFETRGRVGAASE